MGSDEVRARERAYHDKLYGGFAQQHFAKSAVRALRAHMAARILSLAESNPHARVLSLGCGIGDTELLIAPRVGELVGIDISSAAVKQAREDAGRAGLRNTTFLEGSLEDLPFEPCSFDLIFAIFLLHHLPDEPLKATIRKTRQLLVAGGRFYALDPSRHRLSGAVGRLLFPKLMRSYQSPDERELDRAQLEHWFQAEDFPCRVGFYDFVSSPLAGLLPGWRAGYLAARAFDELLIRTPLVKRLGSNLEVIAHRP
jgi:SAM-dependent methyltransferase